MGTYTVTTLTATARRPFYFRCVDCGALNLGLFPISAQSSYTDRNAGLRRSTRESVMSERRSNAKSDANNALQTELRHIGQKALNNGWEGSEAAPGVCARCHARQPWNKKQVWRAVFMVSAAVHGFLTLFLLVEALRGHIPWSSFFIAAGILAALIAGYTIAGRLYIGRNDRVPRASRPHIYGTMEEFEAGISEAYDGSEELYGVSLEMAQFIAAFTMRQKAGQAPASTAGAPSGREVTKPKAPPAQPAGSGAPPTRPVRTATTPVSAAHTATAHPGQAEQQQKNLNPHWVTDTSGMVVCPKCGEKRSAEFIKLIGKCPSCGQSAFDD